MARCREASFQISWGASFTMIAIAEPGIRQATPPYSSPPQSTIEVAHQARAPDAAFRRVFSVLTPLPPGRAAFAVSSSESAFKLMDNKISN